MERNAYSKRKKCGYKILTFNGQTIILLFREEVRLSSLIKTWLQSNKPPNTLYYILYYINRTFGQYALAERFLVFERLFQLVIQFFRHWFQPLVAMALLYILVVGEMLKP